MIILSSAYNDCKHAECETLPKGAASGTPAAASSVAVLANLRRDLLPLSETLLSFDTCSLLKETKTLGIFNLLRPFITYPALLVLKFHFFLPIRKKKNEKKKTINANVPHGFTSIQLSDLHPKRPGPWEPRRRAPS